MRLRGLARRRPNRGARLGPFLAPGLRLRSRLRAWRRRGSGRGGLPRCGKHRLGVSEEPGRRRCSSAALGPLSVRAGLLVRLEWVHTAFGRKVINPRNNGVLRVRQSVCLVTPGYEECNVSLLFPVSV